MTIDECILDCIHYTSTDLCKYEGIHWSKSQIEQIAEWLEELKELKKSAPNRILYTMGHKAGYNKAIDDFVELVHKYDWNIRDRKENAFIYCAVDTLAERLKAGKEVKDE